MASFLTGFDKDPVSTLVAGLSRGAGLGPR